MPLRIRAAAALHRIPAIATGLVAMAGVLALGFLAVDELAGSRVQAHLMAAVAADATWERGPGAATVPEFPRSGPYDLRLGYARMPAFLGRLRDQGASILSQARWSRTLRELVEAGLSPPYAEKDRAGLRVRDRDGRMLYAATWPRRAWATLDDVPPIVIDTVRYIENRELLDRAHPFRNPAVEWDRLALALETAVERRLGSGRRAFGGSTLATQVEKFRHSDGGRTRTAADKARQMESAALRAYRDGPVTLAAQRQILLSWVNSLPLGAVPGYGEVLGLPDGLWSWFGRDLADATRLLERAGLARLDGPDADEAARAYREVLGLVLAQRRPAWYRGEGRATLEARVDAHLRLLAREGVIPRDLRDRALAVRLGFQERAAPDGPDVVEDRKAVDAVRISLLSLLGMDSLHDLDRLDLEVRSTLDARLQAAVDGTLKSLAQPAQVKRLGLRAPTLLGAGDPSALLFGFVLYERDGNAAVMRAQTDQYDGPFSLNDQMKLELGSTAKLRTLVSYLELVAEIRDRLSQEGAAATARARTAARDRLTRFVAGWMVAHPGGGLPDLLQAALDRTYSASPHEVFRTGGGLHVFGNYHRHDDGRSPAVRDAFHESINLAFVRLLRDVIQTLVETGPTPASEVLADASDPRRGALLARFADEEGRVFQEEAWRAWRGMDPAAAAERLLDRVPREARRIAAAFRALRPEADVEALGAALRTRLGARTPDPKRVADLHAKSVAPPLVDLQDVGYVAGVHPLDLVTVAWRTAHPAGTFEEMVRDTAAQRQEVYRWLFRSTRKEAQDLRIGDVIEREAFERLRERWARLGYPFPTLVPSLATAIGSSGDQPRALAELAGIVQAGGLRVPLVRVDRLRFARGTPYDTEVGRPGTGALRVMRQEVADAVRAEMVGVVEHGTARRVKAAFRVQGGRPMEIGGKTGTGDNRHETIGPRGEVIASEARNRTGTFVFFVGDRWFGAVTAYMPGERAARYRFTSALPVEVLRLLAPSILASDDSPSRAIAAWGVPSASGVLAEGGAACEP